MAKFKFDRLPAQARLRLITRTSIGASSVTSPNLSSFLDSVTEEVLASPEAEALRQDGSRELEMWNSKDCIPDAEIVPADVVEVLEGGELSEIDKEGQK